MKISTVVSWAFDWAMVMIVASIVGSLTDNLWYVASICLVMSVYGLKQYMEGYMKHSQKISEVLVWNILKH